MADEEVIHVFERRILALSKAHGLLGRESWNGVSLRDVIGEILQPFGLNDGRVAPFLGRGRRRSPATESIVDPRHGVP
jgi:two-component sensor histidine kinase